MTDHLWWYRAKLDRVVDGDTVILMLDHGFEMYARRHFRLYGINTPEVVGTEKPAGLAAKTFLENLLSQASQDGVLMVRSIKDSSDKYGRYLAEVFVPMTTWDPAGQLAPTSTWEYNPTGQLVNVNELMVLLGHAVVYMLGPAGFTEATVVVSAI